MVGSWPYVEIFGSGRASARVVSPVSWTLLALLAAIDLFWLALSPLRFAKSNFWIIGGASFVFSLWFFVFRLILYRLRDDISKIGSVINAVARSGDNLVRGLAFVAFFGWAGGTYLCLAVSTALPLQDARLASFDQMLGFDWLAFLVFTNSHRVVSWCLSVAYHSAFAQMMLLCVLLSFRRWQQRLSEFLSLFSVTFVATCFLMLLVPAAGAYPYYSPSREMFDGFSADAGMWHYQAFTMLRTEPTSLLRLENMKGLVTFPSFHTALAIITAYAARGIPFVRFPAVILNVIVIISTLPEGGHFLVDVLAGAFVAVAAIGLVHWEPSGRFMSCRS